MPGRRSRSRSDRDHQGQTGHEPRLVDDPGGAGQPVRRVRGPGQVEADHRCRAADPAHDLIAITRVRLATNPAWLMIPVALASRCDGFEVRARSKPITDAGPPIPLTT